MYLSIGILCYCLIIILVTLLNQKLNNFLAIKMYSAALFAILIGRGCRYHDGKSCLHIQSRHTPLRIDNLGMLTLQPCAAASQQISSRT